MLTAYSISEQFNFKSTFRF